MKKETLSDAIGEVNAKYVLEAIQYIPRHNQVFKARWLKYIIAAALCICFFIGYSVIMPFHQVTIAAYVYDTKQEVTADTVLSTGFISDSGEMQGALLRFYFTGKGIQSIRFSCKNQWLEFMDWTEQRDEYGKAKNFTVRYGLNENEYNRLVITWQPNDTISALNSENITIQDLPKDLQEDLIVMEIRFENGTAATKAIHVKLQNDGHFTASFTNYEITPQDTFVLQPDSEPIGAKPIPLNKEIISPEEINFTDSQIENAKQEALKYYKENVPVIEVTSLDITGVQENKIIFTVSGKINKKYFYPRTIILQNNNNLWKVITEGY